MKAQRLEPTSKKQRKITELLKNWARLSKQVCYTQVWVPQISGTEFAATLGLWARAQKWIFMDV